MGTLMRRSSTGLGLGTHHKSESKTSLSDSSTKGSNLKLGTTLQPPEIASYTIVSPVAESPAREAEASHPSPIVGPSPLGAIPGSRPQDSPPRIPVALDPLGTRPPEPELRVVESPPSLIDSPKTQEPPLPVAEQVSGNISDYVEPQPTVKTPEVTPRDVEEESNPVQPQVESGMDSINKDFGIHAARVEEPEPEPQPVSIPTPEPAPVMIQVPEQPIPPPQVVSDVRELPLLGPAAIAIPPEDHSPWAGVITRNDNLSSQPRTPPNPPKSLSPKQSRASFAGTVFESVNGSQQYLPRQISNKPSKTSLTPSYTWSTKTDPHQKPALQVVDHGTNADARTISSARFTADDPFVDPPPVVQPTPYLYPTEQPPQQDEAESSTSHAHITMPLPAAHEVIKNRSLHTVPSSYSLGASKTAPHVLEMDETRPLLPKPTHPDPDGSSGTKNLSNGQVMLSYPSNPWEATRTPLQSMGWRHITLPDNSVYFYHLTLRVTTDIDLRTPNKLDAITSYLQENSIDESFLPPEGWESWLVDSTVGKKRNPRPISSWVNHAERILTFASPSLPDSREITNSKSLDDDRLDLEYRYWAFMESHPAHAPLPPSARSDALDALTWSYTDCLLPSARPVPPPFSQDECQELIRLLETLGHPDLSESQSVVHTRIVSRVLMRLAQWRQHYFRPDRPLPKDASNRQPRGTGKTFSSRLRDLFMSTVCLGLPYLFMRRANPLRITDEESVARSAGPMLAIGACSCLVAAIILSASVTLVSLPGLDNLGRIAGFVAILCSAASMISAVIALFRYKADVERAVVYMGGEGLVMLSRRSIVMSLPLVFLVWGIVAFITAITLYSFRGFTVTSPGTVKQPFTDYTHWTVVGTMGVLAGALITSALLMRR